MNFDYKYINTYNQVFGIFKTSFFYNKNKYGSLIEGMEKSVFKNAQNGNGVTAMGHIRKSSKKNEISSHYIYRTENLVFNEKYSSSRNYHSLSGTFSHKLNKTLKYKISAQLKSEKNITNNVSVVKGIYSSCSNLIEYSINSIKMKFEYIYTYDKIDNSYYHKNLLNIDSRYDFKEIPIYLELVCKNIFYLKEYKQVFEKNSYGINQIIEFQNYPGYIILKLGLNF